MPPLQSAADLALIDAWIAQTIGIYTGEVTIRRAEHACLDNLRKGRVIR